MKKEISKEDFFRKEIFKTSSNESHSTLIKKRSSNNFLDDYDENSSKNKSTHQNTHTLSFRSSSSKSIKSLNTDNKNLSLFKEMWIQLNYNCPIPGVILEVNNPSFPGWDTDDLEIFLNGIGEVKYFQATQYKTLVVFFKFYDALLAINYFSNQENFKLDAQNEFNIDWARFDPSNKETCFSTLYPEFGKIIENQVNSIFQTYSAELTNNIQESYFPITLEEGFNSQEFLEDNKFNEAYSFNNLNNSEENHFNESMMNMNLNQNTPLNLSGTGLNLNNSMSMQNLNFYSMNLCNLNISNNINCGILRSGKYTCKFEVLIENEPEFLVSRKIIGPKGINMKKILDDCEDEEANEYSDLKLRLRGKNSGFKEGPMNCESDEPLHLCISSRSLNIYNKAKKLVESLFSNITDDYKKFCHKKNKKPVKHIFIIKDEGISNLS